MFKIIALSSFLKEEQNQQKKVFKLRGHFRIRSSGEQPPCNNDLT